MHQIWKPNVGYTNAKLGRLEKESLGIMVRRESEPQPFDFSSAIEGIIFNFCHGTQRFKQNKYYKVQAFSQFVSFICRQNIPWSREFFSNEN